MFPGDLFSLQLKTLSLISETQTVMALRLMGMSGMIPAAHGENGRMLSEKGPAMAQAFAAGSKVMMAGGRPDQIMAAAMVPVSTRVSSNRKRLLK